MRDLKIRKKQTKNANLEKSTIFLEHQEFKEKLSRVGREFKMDQKTNKKHKFKNYPLFLCINNFTKISTKKHRITRLTRDYWAGPKVLGNFI
jgi:hypothetical protein